jgi:hypothetical protein
VNQIWRRLRFPPKFLSASEPPQTEALHSRGQRACILILAVTTRVFPKRENHCHSRSTLSVMLRQQGVYFHTDMDIIQPECPRSSLLLIASFFSVSCIVILIWISNCSFSSVLALAY